ncbi:MAG TPA: hypothetical protein VGG49_02380 [Steroidobacteraceae bacterium]|jgi:hypothetical protein
MRAALWRALAWFITRPGIRRRIVQWAMRHPYSHIGSYMGRWWVVPQTWGLPFAIRLHHIVRSDADPYVHDHPWNWRTVILYGWYEEEDVEGIKRIQLEGDTRAATSETFHRINSVSTGGVWTFFIMGRRTNRWGFMVGCPARKVYYRDYVSENDRGELVLTQHWPHRWPG